MNHVKDARFEVFTATNIDVEVFWVVTPRSDMDDLAASILMVMEIQVVVSCVVMPCADMMPPSPWR
jgi:hypothetical protein